MAGSDLEIFDDSGGELAPYSPAVPLSPSPDIGTDVDLFAGDSPQLFGTPVQSQEQTELIVLQIASTFRADAVKLGLSPQFTQAAIQVFKRMAASPVPNQRPTHNFNLTNLNISSEDQPYITAFANQMQRLGADETSVRKCIYWYGLLCAHLNGGQQQPQHRKPTGEVSDRELAQRNREKEQGRLILQQRWGYEYQSRLNIIVKYLAQFPASERDIEFRVLPNGNLAGNDPDFLEYLYRSALGLADTPHGPALAKAISDIESTMGTKAYTEVAQAKLRLLYDLRDGE